MKDAELIELRDEMAQELADLRRENESLKTEVHRLRLELVASEGEAQLWRDHQSGLKRASERARSYRFGSKG